MLKEKRFMVFGAHPDDADLMFGGTALKLITGGNKVKFVSVANGDCGHFSMSPEELAERRYLEAQASAEIAGLEEYQILDNLDCTVTPSLENREKIVRIIRQFEPDVVISHRTNDYHPDHRATAQLVQDASFLVMVPLFCPDVSIPEIQPVFCSSWDRFQCPHFRADIVLEMDSVFDGKLKMLDCHKSQFYEWLPWDKGYKDFDYSKLTKLKIKKWLIENWLSRNFEQAKVYRDKVKEFYGKKANHIKYVESFEITEYGRMPSKEEIRELFFA